MAIFRIEKNKNYTVMSNYHLRDKNLSLKAKGLLSIMLSLPENWDYSVAGLVAICKEYSQAINNILHELEDNGYLERKKIYENGKIRDWEYIIYENPKQLLYVENQNIENQNIENQHIENHIQYNINNKLNTKKQNIEHIKRFIPPTKEEVIEYARTRNRVDLVDQFYDYFTTGNWVDSKGNKVRNWKQKFITWEKYQVSVNRKDVDFPQRQYTKEEINDLFVNLDEVKIDETI